MNLRTTVLFVLLIHQLSCSTTKAPLAAAAEARLDALASAPGELIYRGDVTVHGTAEPAFRYTRRVQGAEIDRTSTHTTVDAVTGELLVVQRASHSPDYSLRHFEEIHKQTGVASSVTVLQDGGLEFLVTRGEDSQSTVEGPGAPAVSGPTLFGFAAGHWDELVAGAQIPVRFTATDAGRSYEFVLDLSESGPETTTFSFRAASVFVRLAIEPMLLVFDTRSRQIVRYSGRVPPRTANLKPVDAEVIYTFTADAHH